MEGNHNQNTITRKNALVNIIDGGFFGFGLGFASFSTFLPLFLAKFTDSPLLFSLIPAIHGLGWQFPQLFSARRMSRLSRYKPAVLFGTLHERLPFIGFALLALFMNRITAGWGVVIFFLLFVWQSFGGGLAANPWQNMISKIIPAANLGTFFGIQSAASNLLASIGSILAGIILSSRPPAEGFFTCFCLTIIGMGVSFIFLSMTNEKSVAPKAQPLDQPNLLSQVKSILSRNKDFRNFFISRCVYQIATMGSAFYIIYWVHTIGILDEKTAGIVTGVLTITQMLAAPAFGWLADRWTHRNVYIVGGICAFFSTLLAIFSSLSFKAIDPVAWAFAAMILIGVSQSIFWTVGLSYSLSFGEEAEKPVFIGIVNTLGAPIAIGVPLIGGLVAAKADYPTTFLVSLIASVITILFLIVSATKHGSAGSDARI